MTTTEWETRWVKALTDTGTPYLAAKAAFKICYGNQVIDTRIDPTGDAKSPSLKGLGVCKNAGFAEGIAATKQ